ncbi:hypothetical protein MMC14_003911 [Varicellaria rhodocarpa]|nr:hypothetical protein [Varicellaria rhodocarpa]
MALAVYSRTQRHPVAATEASLRYDRLLRVAQERIAQVGISIFDERDIDACLLVVFLMGRYEAVTYRPSDLNPKDSFSTLRLWFHHNGAMAILKVWYDNPGRTPATFIIKQTRRGLIRSSLLRNLPLPDWLIDGEIFGERDLELDYDRIFVRSVNLHHVSVSFRQKNNVSITRAKDLNNEAQELDKALEDWVTRFPSIWSYQQHTLKEPDLWPGKHFYYPVVYSHSNFGYAAVWNQYFSLRMLVNSTHLRILEIGCPLSTDDIIHEQQQRDCMARLKVMSDSLAISIPSCLERFKAVDVPNSLICQTAITLNTDEKIKPNLAVLAVWPLTVASSLEGIDSKQQLWFRSQLARLGKTTGEGVLERTETDPWITL